MLASALLVQRDIPGLSSNTPETENRKIFFRLVYLLIEDHKGEHLMKSTYQHRIIARHLQNKFGHLNDWPFCSAAEIEEELCRKSLSLAVGDYLVVSMGRSGVRCEKAADLHGLAAFPSDSLVIPYHELERAFHEQYADYVEL